MTAVLIAPPEPSPEPAAPAPGGPYRASRPARVLRGAGASLTMCGLLLLGFVCYLAFVTGVQHSRDQTTMYASLRDELAHGTAPVGPSAPGTPLAVLRIPRIGVHEVVVEGSSASQLMHGPGHRRDTPLPGQPGVSVVYGRNVTYGGPFGRLGDLRSGDTIDVTTGQGTAHYRVTDTHPSKIVPSGSSTLVLVTADSPVTPSRDAVVVATLLGTPVAGNSSLPPIGRAELGMSGESSAAIALIFWVQGLLLATVGTTWAYVRWHRWPTYLVSSPLLLAGLWNVFENLARLLPNTL